MMQNPNMNQINSSTSSSFYDDLSTIWPKIEEPSKLSSLSSFNNYPMDQSQTISTIASSSMFNNHFQQQQSNSFFNYNSSLSGDDYQMGFDSLLLSSDNKFGNGGIGGIGNCGYNSLDNSVTPSPTMASKTPSPIITNHGCGNDGVTGHPFKYHHHQQQHDESSSLLSIPIMFDDEINNKFSKPSSPPTPISSPLFNYNNDAMIHGLQQQPQPTPEPTISKFELATSATSGLVNLPNTVSLMGSRSHYNPHPHSYCETVAVESTAHVAQIVGKNGCRIKHLRAKFGTYIHTPSSTDEPVFIIKGPREKVLEVKQEIIKADNHFASIKDQRNAKISKLIETKDSACIRLYIPNKYVGLVVGRNGWFVKDLQTKFNIYIETPKFDLCNYFQFYGKRNNLLIVKKLIFDRITTRTGITFIEKQDKEDVFIIE